ncbi:hypothetical protein IK110_00435 [Candidatus Saccharibacteria bacterium]|nr:hypothetical protein [Candidatus Saccharibacteria bacterium]
MGKTISKADERILITALDFDSVNHLRMLSKVARQALVDAGVETIGDFRYLEDAALEKLKLSEDDLEMARAAQEILINTASFP